jgi:hypothetical protein
LYGAAYLTEQQYESISAILKKEGPSLANNGSPYSPAHSQHAAQAIPGHHDTGPDQYPWLPAAALASPVHLPLSPAMSKRSESMGTSSAATVTDKLGTDGSAPSRLEGTCEPEGKRQPPTCPEAVKVELKPDISGAIDALLAEASSAADNHGPLLVGMADPVPKLVSNNTNLVNQYKLRISSLYVLTRWVRRGLGVIQKTIIFGQRDQRVINHSLVTTGLERHVEKAQKSADSHMRIRVRLLDRLNGNTPVFANMWYR